ncbi:uncharacterized protein [Diadema antillarum]|uniref:uncharacterized protein n=1 Tax=Diadema antillarum TaxID=105358 RepID=UPI003A85D519
MEGTPGKQSKRSKKKKTTTFHHRAGIAIGSIQLVFGILSAFLGGSSYALYHLINHPGCGLWCGILIVAYMVMCIFTAIIGPFMMVIEGVIAGVTALVFTCPTLIHPLSDIRVLGIQLISSSICTIFGEEAAMFIHGILSFIGLVEFVVAVVGSAFCCDGLCCGRSPRRVSPENDVVVYIKF